MRAGGILWARRRCASARLDGPRLGGHITRTGGDHVAGLEQSRESVDDGPATDRRLFPTQTLRFSHDVLGLLASAPHRLGGQARELTAKTLARLSRRTSGRTRVPVTNRRVLGSAHVAIVPAGWRSGAHEFLLSIFMVAIVGGKGVTRRHGQRDRPLDQFERRHRAKSAVVDRILPGGHRNTRDWNASGDRNVHGRPSLFFLLYCWHSTPRFLRRGNRAGQPRMPRRYAGAFGPSTVARAHPHSVLPGRPRRSPVSRSEQRCALAAPDAGKFLLPAARVRMFGEHPAFSELMQAL